MGQKNNGKSAAAFKFLVCAVLFLLFSETAFAQVSSYLTLNIGTDTRFETFYTPNTNNVAGYNLYVRKKPGMESVMLTEPTGNYALRTLERYEENDAIRNLSGKRLPPNDPYSCNSIISSIPFYDSQFRGEAFKLVIPANVIYGNPSSRGPVLMYVLNGIQFNIRTFDQKYGDPNRGNFQNNLTAIPPMESIREISRYEPVTPNPSPNDVDALRWEWDKTIPSDYGEFLSQMNNGELNMFLYSILWEMKNRTGM